MQNGGLDAVFTIFFRTIYVAEFANDRLVGYQRQPNNDLAQIWVIF